MHQEKWRLCQRRPEVGFDLQWGWGSLEEMLRAWTTSKAMPGLYIQRAPLSSKGKSMDVVDYEIDHEHLDKLISSLRGW
jgi:hypothetical protein